jgi:hypothetical protein
MTLMLRTHVHVRMIAVLRWFVQSLGIALSARSVCGVLIDVLLGVDRSARSHHVGDRVFRLFVQSPHW